MPRKGGGVSLWGRPIVQEVLKVVTVSYPALPQRRSVGPYAVFSCWDMSSPPHASLCNVFANRMSKVLPRRVGVNPDLYYAMGA